MQLFSVEEILYEVDKKSKYYISEAGYKCFPVKCNNKDCLFCVKENVCEVRYFYDDNISLDDYLVPKESYLDMRKLIASFIIPSIKNNGIMYITINENTFAAKIGNDNHETIISKILTGKCMDLTNYSLNDRDKIVRIFKDYALDNTGHIINTDWIIIKYVWDTNRLRCYHTSLVDENGDISKEKFMLNNKQIKKYSELTPKGVNKKGYAIVRGNYKFDNGVALYSIKKILE